MKKAYLFPGQGAQFVGMGKELFETSEEAQALFLRANEVLGFSITDKMFSGTDADLKETQTTQPAVFIHSVISYLVHGKSITPDAVAGHSLGEFSALVANGALSFEDALSLVYKRAIAMQKACEMNPSGMSVVLGFDDEKVKEICNEIEEVVVPANFNCPGQLVISGSFKGLEIAGERIKAAGAKRVMPLKVGGAFHSPLMMPAQEELKQAIEATQFSTPICPIYQNFSALPCADPEVIKQQLISQLTAPVLWTRTIENMVKDGFSEFIEFGPGEVLQGLVKKTYKEAVTSGRS